MTESSFSGDDDLTAVHCRKRRRNRRFRHRRPGSGVDDPVSSAAGTVIGEDAIIASPPEDPAVDETTVDADQDTSHDADVAAGYDDADPDATQS